MVNVIYWLFGIAVLFLVAVASYFALRYANRGMEKNLPRTSLPVMVVLSKRDEFMFHMKDISHVESAKSAQDNGRMYSFKTRSGMHCIINFAHVLATQFCEAPEKKGEYARNSITLTFTGREEQVKIMAPSWEITDLLTRIESSSEAILNFGEWRIAKQRIVFAVANINS